MGDFFKKLFNFDNIKKLFTYNWGDVFNHIVPKGKKITINEEEFTNVQNGAILMASGSVISAVLMALVSLFITAAASVLVGGLVAGVIITTLLIALLGALVVPAFIFIYNRVTKDKEQGTVVYFIIWILGLLSALSLIYSLISWIGNILTAPIYAIFGIACLFLNFLGIVHLLVGTIDICTRANKTVAPAASAENTNTEVSTDGNVESVNPSVLTDNEGPKFCPKCGAPTNGGKFCPKCGNPLQ